MNRKSNLLITLVGAGIMGLLTGCGASEPIETITPIQSSPSEFIEQTDNSKRTDSGNNVLDNGNQPFEENSNQTENSNTNNASTSGILSGEDKQSEPTPNGESEVIALADSEEEAQRIAGLYQIELKSFSLGVAVYTTDKNVAELIQMGKDNNYPEIAPNNQKYAY